MGRGTPGGRTMGFFHLTSVRTFARRCILGATAAALTLGLTSPAQPRANVFNLRVKVDGSARAWAGDCPDFAPSVPMSCHEWQIWLFSEGATDTGGGAVSPAKTP